MPKERPEGSSSEEFAKLLKLFELKSRDSPQEIKARIEAEREEARHQREIGLLMFRFLRVVVGAITCCSIWIAVSPWATSAHQKDALALLGVIASGWASYTFGKNSK